MGYIKYNCEKFRENYNQYESKCSINKLEKALYDFEKMEGELKIEFLEVKEILEESKREIKELIHLTNQQGEIDKQVNEWIKNCKNICNGNIEECTCSEVNTEGGEEIKEIGELIKEALCLVDETLEKVEFAKELINKKRGMYDSIRNNCYEELCEDYRFCYEEYDE